MKILIVNEKFGEEGGAERYSLDIADALASRGHGVGFLCERNIKDQRSKIKNTDQNSNLKKWFVRGFEVGGVIKVCEEFKPEVVYLQNVFDPEVTEFFSGYYPTFRFIHDHQTYCPGRSKMWFAQNEICTIPFSWRCGVNAFCKRCMSRRPQVIWRELSEKPRLLRALMKLRKIIVASEFMKSQLVQNGIDEKRILVNPLFASKDFENATSKPNRSEEKKILFVGRVFIEKGLEYPLRALAKVSDAWGLQVIGDGWDLERCKKIASDLGISEKVDFLGFLPHKETLPYFQDAYMVVVPSIWPEPFCLVGLEAMSLRKPVVAFDVGGISTWLKDGENGFLVKRGDIDGLAGRISALLNDSVLATKLGEAGREFLLEKFTLEGHLSVLEETFEKDS